MKNITFRKKLAAIIACVCLLTSISVPGILAAGADVDAYVEQEVTFTNMEILYAEDQLVFIPEFPNAEYSAGIHVNYSDTSMDIPDPSTILWTSDNLDIFWVNTNGAIHPTGVGTANITAEYAGHSVTQAITIKAGSIVAIEPETDEIVSPEARSAVLNIPVYAHASNGMVFTITDPDDITWSSTNARVAPNNEGGLMLPENVDTTLMVSAFGQTELVEVFSIDKSDIVLTTNTVENTLIPNQVSTIFISATSSGHTFDVTTKAQWSVSDETVVQVIDGYVAAGALGEATITVTYEGQTLEIPIEVVPAPQNYDAPAFG